MNIVKRSALAVALVVTIAPRPAALLDNDMAHMPDFMNEPGRTTRMVHGAETVQDLTEDNVVVMNGGSLTVTGTLRVLTLMVMENSELTLGPQAQVVFRDAPINTAYDPEQFGHGLIVMGRVRGLGFAKTVRARLMVEPSEGATTLQLEEPVTGWQVGDVLALGDTRAPWWDDIDWAPKGVPDGTARPRATTDLTELPRVASVSGDGKTVALQTPLLYTHPGAHDHNGAVVRYPVVTNQTRSIVLRSENPTGIRGHTMFSDRADVDLEYVEFDDLGRTCAEQLDNTTWANNVPTHIGDCQNGRYALHSHHLNGPVNSSLGHQAKFVGLAVNNPLKWGIAIHDSHYGLYQNNSIVGAIGAGIVTETGQEIGNDIDGNTVTNTSGSNFTQEPEDIPGGTPPRSVATRGVGFWTSGFGNNLTNNIAIDSRQAGFQLVSGLTGSFLQTRCPKFPGADPTSKPDGFGCTPDSVPQGVIQNNEAIRSPNQGFIVYATPSRPMMTLDGVTVWHVMRESFQSPLMSALTLDHFWCVGGLNLTESCWAIQASTTVVIRHVFIDQANVGIGSTQTGYSAVTPSPTFTVDTGTIHAVHPIQHTRDLSNFLPASQPPSVITTLKDLTLGNVGGWARTPTFIDHTAAMADYLDVTQSARLLAFNVNGGFFEIFTPEQAPDAPMPATGAWTDPATNRPYVGVVGIPEAGLTVQQSWEKYGVAFNGRVAPCADTVDGIVGFVCPITDPPKPPVPPISTKACVGTVHGTSTDNGHTVTLTGPMVWSCR
jgi:hypothetical protein